MTDHYPDGNAATNLLERRWFAALAAVKALQAECEMLREVMQLAEVSWRRTRAQLAALEKLRDGLGDELAALDDGPPAVMSAA
jgi:hypothetical protein